MASAAVLRAGFLVVPPPLPASSPPPFFATVAYARAPQLTAAARSVRYRRRGRTRTSRAAAAAAITASLDLTEDNVRLALDEAKSEPQANAAAGLVCASAGAAFRHVGGHHRASRSRGVGRAVREAPAQGQVLAHPRHRGREDRKYWKWR
ncbi:unnamed protein product [Urochloa humidicola]